MTAPDIVTEARRLLDAATPGPWYWRSFSGDIVHLNDGPPTLIADLFNRSDRAQRAADAAFIAAAPRLVTELVAEVERLRDELDQRTDPELAESLHMIADVYDRTRAPAGRLGVTVGLLRRAARLLGGER